MSRAAAAEAPLSRFTLGRELARGGMGAVHVATDTVTGEQVALKLLLDDADDDASARFERELRAAAALDSPHICRAVAWSLGGEGAARYLAMELIDGPTLSQVAKLAHADAARDARDALPASVLLEILRQLLTGLAVAHDAHVLHRDLKPANVMVTRAGVVKLVDFGISRGATDATVTKTGDIVGTPAFMSPEQVRGDPLDGRSDLFSLGVTLQAVIRGNHRFQGLESTQMLLRTIAEPTAPLLEEAPHLPLALDNLLAALTALHTDHRVPDARAALALLGDAGAVRPDGPTLLAAYLEDMRTGRTDVARRENVAACARELTHAQVLEARPGGVPAALLALERAAALDPTSAAPALRDALAAQHQLSLDAPADPALAARADACVMEAHAAWRDPPRAAASYKRAADVYAAARCPRRQAICLWRYVRERPDDSLAHQQLQVLLDGPALAGRDDKRLSTRSIVAGIRTGGRLTPHLERGVAATVQQRAPAHARPPADAPARAGARDAARAVVLTAGDVTDARSSRAGAALLALLVIAALVLVVRMVVDTAGAAQKTFAQGDAPAEAAAAHAEARAQTKRLDVARAALDARDWAAARALSSEVLAAAPSIDEAQQARAIRARAALALDDRSAARADLEAYRAKVTRDDDAFLAEANRLLATMREPTPAVGGLR